MLTAENVEKIFIDCLFKDGDDPSSAKVVEGITSKFLIYPKRLTSYKEEISSMLNELPDNFKEKSGGGWSFLNACMTKKGDPWGEHRNIEQLLVLGIATDQAKILMPREMWAMFPGGMPYFAVMEAA